MARQSNKENESNSTKIKDTVTKIKSNNYGNYKQSKQVTSKIAGHFYGKVQPNNTPAQDQR